MCWVTQRGMAAIGTTLHIQQHARFPDGRMQIDSKGMHSYEANLAYLTSAPSMGGAFSLHVRGQASPFVQVYIMRAARSCEAWLAGMHLSFDGKAPPWEVGATSARRCQQQQQQQQQQHKILCTHLQQLDRVRMHRLGEVQGAEHKAGAAGPDLRGGGAV